MCCMFQPEYSYSTLLAIEEDGVRFQLLEHEQRHVNAAT